MAEPNAAAAIDERDKVPWLTRVAYGLGDTAQNIVWGAMSILTFFYTDYAGINPATVWWVHWSPCLTNTSTLISPA